MKDDISPHGNMLALCETGSSRSGSSRVRTARIRCAARRSRRSAVRPGTSGPSKCCSGTPRWTAPSGTSRRTRRRLAYIRSGRDLKVRAVLQGRLRAATLTDHRAPPCSVESSRPWFAQRSAHWLSRHSSFHSVGWRRGVIGEERHASASGARSGSRGRLHFRQGSQSCQCLAHGRGERGAGLWTDRRDQLRVPHAHRHAP